MLKFAKQKNSEFLDFIEFLLLLLKNISSSILHLNKKSISIKNGILPGINKLHTLEELILFKKERKDLR